jgi:hypothetical protein
LRLHSLNEQRAHLDNDPLKRAANSIGIQLVRAIGETTETTDIVPYDGRR